MISFPFKVGKAFLEASNHPITIPQRNNTRLIEEVYQGKGNRSIPVRITPVQGRNLNGEIYYGVSSYGPYYQIKILGNYPGYYLGDLKIGDFVFITVKRVDNIIEVKIHSSAELRKNFDNFCNPAI